MSFQKVRLATQPLSLPAMCLLLLEPSVAVAAVTISSFPTKNMVCSAGVCSPTSASAVLNASDLANVLASGDVEVTTGSGPLAAQVADIVVAKTFSWTSAHALTFDAYRSIDVNKAVSVAGPGALNLQTNDGGSGGLLRFSSAGSFSFFSTANALSIDGASFTLVDSIASLASAVTADASGNYALANSYNAGSDGTYTQAPIQPQFTGNFQGLGNTISKLAIRDSIHDDSVGLFKVIEVGGMACGIHVTAVKIKANRADETGALAGANGGTICNSSTSGKITAGKGSTGGLVGFNGGLLLEDSSSATVNGGGGGLVGTNNAFAGVIRDCYAKGIVSVGGGLVDGNYGMVVNSYALGPILGGPGTPCSGGLVCYNKGSVSTSYSAGAVGSGTDRGGLIAVNYTMASISQSYWDITTSGMSQGCGTGDCAGATGLTDDQLKSGLPAGFDPSVWGEKSGVNGGLPYLLEVSP